jgi:hypothetical protein
MSLRLKLILSISIGAVIILAGTVFALPKTGVIHLNIFADAPIESLYVRPIDSGGNDLPAGTSVFAGDTMSATEALNINSGNGTTTKVNIAIFKLYPNTTYEIKVTGYSCKLKATVGVDGRLAINPFVYSCSTTSDCPAGQTYNQTTHECQANDRYTIKGSVTNGSIGIEKVSVNGVKTDANGEYTISGLSIASQSTQVFTFSKEGWTTKKKKFTQIVHQAIPVKPTAFADPVVLTSEVSTKFSLIGAVKDASGTFLDKVKVKVTCPSSSSGCSGKGPWTGDSTAQEQTNYPNITEEYNYQVKDIYNFASDDTISGMYVEYTKDGYFDDKNGDGIDNDQDQNRVIDKGDIVNMTWPDGTWANIARKNVTLVKKDSEESKRYYIIGGWISAQSRYTGIDVPIADISVNLKDPDLNKSTKSQKKITNIPYTHIENTDFSVEGNYYFDLFLGQEGEYSISLDLPKDSPYLVGLEYGEKTFKLSEARDTGNDYRGKDVYQYIYNVGLKLNPENCKKLIVYGNVSGVYPADLSDIALHVKYAGGEESASARNGYTFEPEPFNNANYMIEVPWSPDLAYGVYARSFSSSNYLLSEGTNFQQFISEDATYNEELGKYTYKHDFSFSPANPNTLELDIRDAATDRRIEGITSGISIKCFSASGEEAGGCLQKGSFDEDTQTWKASLRYTNREFVIDHYLLTIEVGDYSRYENKIGTSSPQTIYLKSKKVSLDDLIVCKTYNGVEFCTYKILADQVFSAAREANLNKLAEVFKYFYPARYSSVPIFIEAQSTSYRDAVQLTLAEIDSLSQAIQHILNTNFQENLINTRDQYYNNFVNARRVARGYRTATEPLLRADGDPVRSCAAIFPDIRSFRNLENDERDAYRNLTIDWLIDHDTINGPLSDPATLSRMNQPNNLHCYNALRNFDWIMISRFPSFRVFSPNATTNTGGNKSSKATIGSGYDIVSIMKEAGFKESTKNSYNVVASILYLNPTSEQIANGSWLKENYNSLSATQKTGIQIKVLLNKITYATTSSKAAVYVRETLGDLNDQLETWLKKIGFKFSTAKVYGTVIDQTGAYVGGLSVNYGTKTDITDADGTFSLNRVTSGDKQELKVVDTKIEKKYNIWPNSLISIKDDEQLGPVRVEIIRKTYLVRGQVMKGNSPLANGSVVVSGVDTYPLNTEGRFSFRLKEGQYSLTFYNKNGKKVSVTNPGGYPDLPAVKVNGVLDSMIWVE